MKLFSQSIVSGLHGLCFNPLEHKYEYQNKINDWRNLSNSYAQLPTIKAMIAKRRKDRRWLALCPPLTALTNDEQEHVWAQMQQI